MCGAEILLDENCQKCDYAAAQTVEVEWRICTGELPAPEAEKSTCVREEARCISPIFLLVPFRLDCTRW